MTQHLEALEEAKDRFGKFVVIDLEADGLLDTVSKIHCMSYSVDGKPAVTLTEVDKMNKLMEKIKDYDAWIVGQNWLGYDQHVCERFLDVKPDRSRVIDTQLLLQLYHPNISRAKDCPKTFAGKRVGKHSLAHMGYWLAEKGWIPKDLKKIEHEDWTTLTPEMIKRCESDVELTVELFLFLLQKEETGKRYYREEAEFKYQLAKQEAYGFRFDMGSARELEAKVSNRMTELENSVWSKLPYRVIQGREIKVRTKTGAYSAAFRKWFDSLEGPPMDIRSFEGTFTRVTFEKPNLNSPQQLKEVLESLGWEPDEWNYKKEEDASGKKRFVRDGGKLVKTTAKVTESSLEAFAPDSPLAKEIKEFLQLSSRHGLIAGLIEAAEADGRVHGGGKSCGADTGRVTHYGIVNVPKAADNILLGKEIRSLFIAGEGTCLMGCDWSNLENVLAANLTYRFDGGAYADIVLNGDSHSNTAKIVSEMTKKPCSRDIGKRVNYAILYGAGAGKMAEITGMDFQTAKRFVETFWRRNAGLGELKKFLEEQASSGYIKGIDGRPISVENKRHAVLNAYIQGAGSIATKLLTNEVSRLLGDETWLKQVLHYHDEFQCELPDDEVHKDKARSLVLLAVDKVNEAFKFKFPLKADIKFAYTWAGSH